MRHYNTYLTTALATLLIAAPSCSQQEGSGPQAPAEPTPTPLCIRAELKSGSSRAASGNTRSIISGTAFTHGQSIHVILTDATPPMPPATAAYTGNGMDYRFTNPSDGSTGVWMPVPPTGETEGLLVKTAAATLLAHYPATLPAGASINKSTATLTPVVTATQQFGTPADGRFDGLRLQVDSDPGAIPENVYLCRTEADYLLGSVADVSLTNNNVSLPMRHALAMLVFRIGKDAANSAPCELKYLKLTNKPGVSPVPLTDGTFSITQGTFTPGSNPQTYLRTMGGFLTGTNFGMLVYPATIATQGDVELEFQADYVRYTIPLPPAAWTSGGVMLYKVKIKGNEATLQTIDVMDWPTPTDHNLPLD